jgi:iron uptake system EfeUOB component EfeO/EfeM
VDYSAQLAAPIAEYKQYVSSELEGLLSQSKAFAAAIKAGDLKKARACTPSPASITTDRADCRAVLRHGRGD